ncbi:MAG: ribosome silencing factor [Verrucomicrobiae bacterium]|nr:ribosome silencing factor [Verrucomicrobiae bacterium]
MPKKASPKKSVPAAGKSRPKKTARKPLPKGKAPRASSKGKISRAPSKGNAARNFAPRVVTSKTRAKTAAAPAPAPARTPERVDAGYRLVRAMHGLLDDKKASEIVVLDVQGISSVTDYILIATATSDPHLKVLAGHLEEELQKIGEKNIGRDGGNESGWIVVDYGNVMAHLFVQDKRAYYGLEELWKDATPVRF